MVFAFANARRQTKCKVIRFDEIRATGEVCKIVLCSENATSLALPPPKGDGGRHSVTGLASPCAHVIGPEQRRGPHPPSHHSTDDQILYIGRFLLTKRTDPAPPSRTPPSVSILTAVE